MNFLSLTVIPTVLRMSVSTEDGRGVMKVPRCVNEGCNHPTFSGRNLCYRYAPCTHCAFTLLECGICNPGVVRLLGLSQNHRK